MTSLTRTPASAPLVAASVSSRRAAELRNQPSRVGVDGSAPSYGALHWAMAEGARRSARLDVVNAYGFDRVAAPIGATSVVATSVVDQDELEKASRALVEEMVAGALGR